jgi:3-hydroxy acid dehydrogenase / malonic semialdehyde reductase
MPIVLYIYGMSKTILITGATSGIGKATAAIFAQNKWNIIITGRRQDRLNELQLSLESDYGIQCLPLCFDVQSKKEVNEALGKLPEYWQNIDVLLNNAGLALGRDYFEEASMDDWETMLDTNVKGLLFVSKVIIPLMIARKVGHIINIGSTAGKEVYEKGNVYCATKHAVDAISKAQRIDLLRHHIKVTCIHPGAVDTEFSLVRFKGNYDTAKKVYEGYEPLSGADVAAVIYFAANTPKHVCINDLVMTCTAQANSFYLQK